MLLLGTAADHFWVGMVMRRGYGGRTILSPTFTCGWKA